MVSTKLVALWPFWMTENQFRSHFSLFRINRQLLYFLKNFTKWPPASILDHRKCPPGGHFGSPIWAILDDRESLSIAFLAISDQYTTCFLIVFSKWPPAAILKVRFAPKTIGFFHFVLSIAMPNMKLIGEFMTQLETPQAFRLLPKIIGFL